MVGAGNQPAAEPTLGDVLAELDLLRAQNEELHRHVIQLRLDQRDMKGTLSDVAGRVGGSTIVVTSPLEDRKVPEKPVAGGL